MASTGRSQVLTLTLAHLKPVLLSIISELLRIIVFPAGSELLIFPQIGFCFAGARVRSSDSYSFTKRLIIWQQAWVRTSDFLSAARYPSLSFSLSSPCYFLFLYIFLVEPPHVQMCIPHPLNVVIAEGFYIFAFYCFQNVNASN